MCYGMFALNENYEKIGTLAMVPSTEHHKYSFCEVWQEKTKKIDVCKIITLVTHFYHYLQKSTKNWTTKDQKQSYM